MLWTAVLLLPSLTVLLVLMDRMEEGLSAPAADRPRHAGRRRHLRLVRGITGEPEAAPAGDSARHAA
ncbi:MULTISPECIES: hypothetical protein [unclassified Streptomyces]|uniref:hypothetical protein n=1 Tax=unclassified Streptomyces TaxID=2593676 RepID=UPI00381A1AF2